METLREKLDRAPLLVRLAPAGAGALIASSVLGITDPRLVIAISLTGVSALALVGVKKLRRPVPVPSGEWFCFEVNSDIGDVQLAGLRRFLEERSRTVGAVFRLVEHFEGGKRRVILGVRGGRDEELVIASVASALLDDKVHLHPVGPCSDIHEPIVRPEPLPTGPGVVLLGYDLSRPLPRDVYLTLQDIEGHIGVYGSTGSGKSTTLRVIASRITGLNVIVLDWTGEHRRSLGAGGFRVIDPRSSGGFDPVRCSGDDWEVALELLSRALELSEPQAYMAEQVLRSGAESVRALYDSLAGLPEETKWDREVKRGLARRLGTLLRSTGGAFGGECFEPEGRVVIDLSGILEAFSRRALANLVLSSLFLRSRREPGDRVLVVVDEAHNLVSGDGRDVLNIILAESRKFGLHLAYATQSPSLIGDLALLNTNTKIVHALRSQKDKRVIIDALGLGEDWILRLDKLSRGVALLQSPSNPKPILIRVEP